MKRFLVMVLIAFGAAVSFLVLIKEVRAPKKSSPAESLKEASYYRKIEDGGVRCELCPNRCLLKEGQQGLCRARENIEGKLYSLVYGKISTAHVDPIEKKPLFHFLPGAKAYSLATTGCNLSCLYCQNWDISQRSPEEVESLLLTPEQVVEEAGKSGSPVIAFTYNEPVIWYEYMLDIAKLAKQKGLRTIMISNGYINQEPLKELLGYLDAVKVDLKAFDDEVYQRMSGGKLQPVLETIKLVKGLGKWLEIVYLVVPGYTDDLEKIKAMCGWLKENAGVDVPVHFSRFWPQYKLLNLPPTAEETLNQARDICLSLGLRYVYIGNVESTGSSATYCPGSDLAVIKRKGFLVEENRIDENGIADGCAFKIDGVWQ